MGHLHSLRRNLDKSFTMKSWQSIYDETLTNSWGWKIRWENRWDLTSSPKHYFWVIYTHYEEILTNHLRWSHDKAYTMKPWQIHEGEKLGEKTGEISPLHLNIIFGSFTLITKKSWQIIYDEVMTKHIRWNLDKFMRVKN